jgi:hypothetical protein
MAKHPKRPASRASFRPIGFLGASTPSAWSDWVAAFVQRLRDGSSFDHLVGHHFASAESQLRDVEESRTRPCPQDSDLAREGQSHSSSDRRLSANSRNSKIADRGVRASSNSQMGGDRPADDDGPPVAGGLRVGRQGRSGSREAPTLCDEKNPCALHRFRCPFQDGLEECLPRC